jgi:hypothetical protein
MPFDGTLSVEKKATSSWLSRLIAERDWRSQLRALFDGSPGPEARAPLVLPTPTGPAVARLLREARHLIETPQRWTVGVYDNGTERCAVGALRAAAGQLGELAAEKVAYGLLLRIAIRRGYSNIETMNDCSSHEQVLSAFDEAIRKVEREPVL